MTTLRQNCRSHQCRAGWTAMQSCPAADRSAVGAGLLSARLDSRDARLIQLGGHHAEMVALSAETGLGVRVAGASLDVVTQARQVLVPAGAAHLVALELR